MLVSNNDKIYAGDVEIIKAYQGDTVIYEKQDTPAYTELEYIEADGSQQINTLYVPTENTKIEIAFQLTATRNENSIFAAKWDLNGFVLMDYGSGLRWHNRSSGFYNIAYNGVNALKKTFTIYRNQIEVDGVSILNGQYNTITYTDSIKLFCFSQKHYAYYKLYGFKIYENDELVHNYIPVLDENNVPCLYDKVSNTYFYNQGSGTFLYG